MAIGSEERLHATLSELVPEGPRDKLWPLRRPAVRIWPGESVAPTAAGTRLGGQPLAAPGTPWPTCAGGPLDLLAQLDLAEVAALLPGQGLPDYGLLLFFYDTETPAWSRTHPDPAGWRVLWEAGPVEPIPQHDDWAVFPGCEVRLEPATTLPRATDENIDLTSAEDDRTDLRLARSSLDNAIGHPPVHHQLLGWPHLLQGAMSWICEQEHTVHHSGQPREAGWEEMGRLLTEADWQLLLQLGSTDLDGWHWGDGGGLYYWIRRKDLAARRFNQVWTVMQC